jgi:hydrogenase nickel incorporation protein HypB
MHYVKLEESLLADNDHAAGHNREMFADHGVYVANLMSAPGAGKTSLLEWTAQHLGDLRMAVIEGDIQGSADADRISSHGVPVVQMNTHGACHLDARQVHTALAEVDLHHLDVLFVENVGNLVCPAEFDLGEHDRVMLLSVTEGHDKPGKYPLMFTRSHLMLLNKIDLRQATDFNEEIARQTALGLNPDLDILPVSCRTGEGLDAWEEWLRHRVAAVKSGERAHECETGDRAGAP